jgi:hypothetical protein
MGRGKHQASLDLIEAAHAILAEIHPATVKAVCYRLFVAGVIPDMSKASTKRVSIAVALLQRRLLGPQSPIPPFRTAPP